MFNLLILAGIAGAAWYFWPQIVAFVKPYLTGE
mgnify:FL=1